MNPNEMELILNQLIKMRPELVDAEYEAQYRACYFAWQAMGKCPEDWSLQELLDADTLERKWYWRKKS